VCISPRKRIEAVIYSYLKEKLKYFLPFPLLMCIFCNNPAGIMRLTERGYEEPDFKAMIKEMVGEKDPGYSRKSYHEMDIMPQYLI